MIDDPRNTVLMMPPSLSHYSLEGEEEMRKLANTVEMAPWTPWDDVSRVWEERGELVVWQAKGMCKSQTAGSPRSAKMQAKKEW